MPNLKRKVSGGQTFEVAGKEQGAGDRLDLQPNDVGLTQRPAHGVGGALVQRAVGVEHRTAQDGNGIGAAQREGAKSGHYGRAQTAPGVLQYSAREAITTAQMAREVFETNWIKLEVIGHGDTLQPDP